MGSFTNSCKVSVLGNYVSEQWGCGVSLITIYIKTEIFFYGTFYHILPQLILPLAPKSFLGKSFTLEGLCL